MIGDPEKDRDLLQSASPVFHADKIRAPLLVARGERSRIKSGIRSNCWLFAIEVDVKYIIKENEGHGFEMKNRFDFTERWSNS